MPFCNSFTLTPSHLTNHPSIGPVSDTDSLALALPPELVPL